PEWVERGFRRLDAEFSRRRSVQDRRGFRRHGQLGDGTAVLAFDTRADVVAGAFALCKLRPPVNESGGARAGPHHGLVGENRTGLGAGIGRRGGCLAAPARRPLTAADGVLKKGHEGQKGLKRQIAFLMSLLSFLSFTSF